uniref:Uncharacterized protein n=1 Tax=Lepeophtheirus salmonis TaxID=72036 RepID=A0A0K2TFH9_LEPSM
MIGQKSDAFLASSFFGIRVVLPLTKSTGNQSVSVNTHKTSLILFRHTVRSSSNKTPSGPAGEGFPSSAALISFTVILCQPDLDCKAGRLSSTDGAAKKSSHHFLSEGSTPPALGT